jgi:hypothetical protein
MPRRSEARFESKPGTGLRFLRESVTIAICMSALPGVPSSSAGALDRRQQALETAATFDRPERGVRTETTLYVPARASEVRSVVILTARGLGDNLFADLAVRSWAESTQSALLLIRFVNLAGLKGTLMPAVRAEALTEALQRLAEGTGRSDLANAPLVFWGHSAGTGVGTDLAPILSSRTIALIRYHGGARGDVAGLRRFPILFFVGGRDSLVVESPETLWKAGRLGRPRMADGIWVRPGVTRGCRDEIVTQQVPDIS